jgi:hypothetical protein
MFLVSLSYRIGKSIVPGIKVLDRSFFGIARIEGFNQFTFNIVCVVQTAFGISGGFVSIIQTSLLFVVEISPLSVVVGAAGIGNTPVGNYTG